MGSQFELINRRRRSHEFPVQSRLSFDCKENMLMAEQEQEKLILYEETVAIFKQFL